MKYEKAQDGFRERFRFSKIIQKGLLIDVIVMILENLIYINSKVSRNNYDICRFEIINIILSLSYYNNQFIIHRLVH